VKRPNDILKHEGEFVLVGQFLNELIEDCEIEKKVSAVEEETRDVYGKATEGGAEEKEIEPCDSACYDCGLSIFSYVISHCCP